MPPFEYRGYQNPYVGSMSALLQRPGDIEAQRAMQVAQAQGNAAQQSGQAYGNAIQGAGQAIAAIPGQIEAQKMNALKTQDLKGQIDERNAIAADRARSNAAQVAGEAAIKSSIDPTTGKVDYEQAASKWEQAGFPTQANAYRESVNKTRQTAQALDEGQQKIEAGKKQVQQAYVNHLGELGAAGLEHLKTATPIEARDYTMGLIANAASYGLIDEASSKQMLMQSAQAGPDQLATIYNKLLDAAPDVKSRLVAEDLKKAETAKNIAEANKQPAAKSYQKSSVLLDGKPAEILTDPTPGGKIYDLSGGVIDNAAARVKPIPSAAAVQLNAPNGGLSDPALQQAAQVYLQTKQLPPGFGAAGIARQNAVMNLAAQIDPTAALAANQATYKADSANLTNLQKTEGTLSAFENTAGKNIDQFLSLAGKVPDSGSPWVNQPMRSVNARALGDADQAAFNAARDVALREIARVTNDPKLSGALTDTARKEVSGLIPADATFAQIKRVAAVLKQDMANVHSGLNEQITGVKARLGSTATTPASTSNRIYYDDQGKPK